ncbi:MAG: short-chain dehydrogenase [Planctomycetaceae bacterium]|nr:short-chain dehydrogenase [Planctomycetaceae bacterium]
MPLTDQVAIVTGGGRGIGLACVRALADDGASVVIATPEDAERSATVAELEANGHAALGTSTDVTSESDLAELVSATLDRFGRIDILVNNAGIIGPTAPMQDVTRDDWEAVMNVNVTGVYLACKAILPHLLEQGSGRIINIASVAGKIGFPLRSPYAASKWAVIGLTKSLAVEVGSAGILVNAVCPGPIDGPRMDAIIQAKAETIGQPAQQVRDQLEKDTLLGRLIPAEHIADMVAFLASDRATSITGQTLDVNAGHLV